MTAKVIQIEEAANKGIGSFMELSILVIFSSFKIFHRFVYYGIKTALKISLFALSFNLIIFNKDDSNYFINLILCSFLPFA